MDHDTCISCSIGVIGDSGVGKSLIVRQFAGENGNVQEKLSGAKSYLDATKVIELDGKKIHLSITERPYGYSSDANIIIYDVTSSNSYFSLTQTVEHVKSLYPKATMLILGNKLDLAERRQVDFDTVKKFADQKGAKHLEFSASHDVSSIEMAFHSVVEDIMNKRGRAANVSSGDRQPEERQGNDAQTFPLENSPSHSPLRRHSFPPPSIPPPFFPPPLPTLPPAKDSCYSGSVITDAKQEIEGESKPESNPLKGSRDSYSDDIVAEMEREPAARITIGKQGGCVAFSTASAFLQFPPDAVSEPVTLTCSRVRYKDCDVKAKRGDAFCSRILKIEPEGIAFEKPVTVLLAHSAAEDGADADYYDLVVQRLDVECEDLKTERISKYEDLPKEIVSDFSHFIKYLPFAKATIVKTCTLVVASRIRSEEIVIQQREACIYSKSYGDESKLKLTFPAGVVENESRLRVQLFPADEVLDTNTWLNEELVCFPVIKVSGQEKPFLKLVDVELIYSHDDVADLNETFLPLGAKFPFSTKYGVLLRSHKDPQAKHKWKNVKDDVNAEIERLQKNRLRITFSVEHFCEIDAIVKKNEEANLGNVEENIDCEHSSPKSYKAIVLAVHDTNVRPNMLSAVLAPKTEVENVEKEWGSKGEIFQKRLRPGEDVYFCVPLSDQEHLSLPDGIVRFFPDEITQTYNNTKGEINLGDKDKRFLLQPCEGRNHSGRYCYVKVRIQPWMKPKTTSVNQTLATTPGIVSCLVDNPRCSYSFSTDENQNQVFCVVKEHCEVFEKKLAIQVEDKLRIIGDMIKHTRGGETTEAVNVAGPVTTVVASLACGIAVALGFTTLGVGSFAGATVAATVLAVTKFDKWRRKADAQVIQGISTEVVSSVLKCIVKEVGKELSRIFEYQLFMLKDERQLDILAHHAVDLMFELKEGDTFDRNTLLRKVLEGQKGKKEKLTTRDGKKNWGVQDVFRKTGLRKAVLITTSKNLKRVKFEYLVKPDNTCDVQRYGYRDQMLEMKYLTSRVQASAAVEKNGSCNPCADCSSDSTCIDGTYFVASDVDREYSELHLEPRNYQPLHCLVQCPKVLERFACSINNTAPGIVSNTLVSNSRRQNERSLVNYVSEMYDLPSNPILKPVFRPHSPSRVPDLTNASLRGCDFSHGDFTGSKLNECDLSECTIFFGALVRASLNGSKFVDAHISHCNFVSAQARCCEWTKVKVLYSCVRDADLRNGINPVGGNDWTGTLWREAITGFLAIADVSNGNCLSEERC